MITFILCRMTNILCILYSKCIQYSRYVYLVDFLQICTCCGGWFSDLINLFFFYVDFLVFFCCFVRFWMLYAFCSYLCIYFFFLHFWTNVIMSNQANLSKNTVVQKWNFMTRCVLKLYSEKVIWDCNVDNVAFAVSDAFIAQLKVRSYCLSCWH